MVLTEGGGVISFCICVCLCAWNRFSCRAMYLCFYYYDYDLHPAPLSLSYIPLSCTLNPPSLSIPPCCSVSLCRSCTAQTDLMQWTISCKHVILLYIRFSVSIHNSSVGLESFSTALWVSRSLSGRLEKAKSNVADRETCLTQTSAEASM